LAKGRECGSARAGQKCHPRASPHNTQPWLFRVSNSNIELYADTTRNTGALDPYRREQHIALGCALENLILAADANGYIASPALLSGTLDGSSGDKVQLVARVELAPGMRQNNELYNAIPNRHTNRNPYDPKRLVPSEFMELLSQLSDEESDVKIFLIAAETDRKRIAEIISAANNVLYADPEVQRGSELSSGRGAVTVQPMVTAFALVCGVNRDTITPSSRTAKASASRHLSRSARHAEERL